MGRDVNAKSDMKAGSKMTPSISLASARFILGAPITLEETRYIEFKEVKGTNPVKSIVNAADDYAVGYLNSEGGRILWGIRDADRVVVGVNLPPVQRDLLRKELGNKLHSIQPNLDPTVFKIDIHLLADGAEESNFVVVELTVPAGNATEPFYTAGGEAFARVDGINKKLNGPQLTAWIKARSGATHTPVTAITDPDLLAIACRIRRIFEAHGLQPGHMERFFTLRHAPFHFQLSDFLTDEVLLKWLSEEKIQWITEMFLVRREWIDGEDSRIQERQNFDKQPVDFLKVISSHLDPMIWDDIGARPEAYFIRWGQNGKLFRQEDQIFVVLAVPIARFSNDRIVNRYVSDLTPYPWQYPRANIQLRAWARIFHLSKEVTCWGCEIPYKLGYTLQNNSDFIHLVVSDKSFRRNVWHPEDYALHPSESAQAVNDEMLPSVIHFLRSHNLPWEELPRRTR